MKLFSAYISSLLGLLMIAAILLPSLHVFEHDLNPQNDDSTHQVVKITQSSIDCDLCEFHFSSVDTPTYFEYDFHLPLKESLYSVSIAQTVYPYPNNNFSLRAPPAMIA